MNYLPAYKFLPLGDNALILDFGNIISEPINELVISIFYQLQTNPLPGMKETVPGYSSLTIYYDVMIMVAKKNENKTAFDQMKEQVEKFLENERAESEDHGSFITIPVCYEKDMGPDLEWIAVENKIDKDEIVRLHTTKSYRVYMLGFLPGFAYMGEVDEKIVSPRKPQPVNVEAGSVGIAGKQTGIYPLRSPGGWRIIGRTPLTLFDKNNKQPTLLKAGDTVKFISISRDEFENIKNRIA